MPWIESIDYILRTPSTCESLNYRSHQLSCVAVISRRDFLYMWIVRVSFFHSQTSTFVYNRSMFSVSQFFYSVKVCCYSNTVFISYISYIETNAIRGVILIWTQKTDSVVIYKPWGNVRVQSHVSEINRLSRDYFTSFSIRKCPSQRIDYEIFTELNVDMTFLCYKSRWFEVSLKIPCQILE